MTQYVAYFEDNEVKFLEGEFQEKDGLLFIDVNGNELSDGWFHIPEVKDTKEKAISALYEKFSVKAKVLVNELNSLEKKRHIIANTYMEMK